MDKKALMEYIRAVGVDDGHMTRAEMEDWIMDNAWNLLMAAYPESRELMREVSGTTAERIFDDLVFNMDGCGIIETYIDENVVMEDDEE